jgi:hypothetical protein
MRAQWRSICPTTMTNDGGAVHIFASGAAFDA